MRCRSTALHWGKDFAVSPRHRCRATLKRVLWLSPQASLLAPLGLLQTGVTRYLFPVLIGIKRGVNVRTFLQDSVQKYTVPATISYTSSIIPHISINVHKYKKGRGRRFLSTDAFVALSFLFYNCRYNLLTHNYH